MTNILTAKEIRPDSSLDELKVLKADWNQFARTAGYPQICWEIARWLGKEAPSPRRGDTLLLFSAGNIHAFGNEEITTRNVARNEWVYERHVAVFVCSGSPQTIAGVVDKGKQVMYWRWHLTGKDDPEPVEDEDNFFVNGEWILRLREFIGASQMAKERYNTTLSDKERYSLAGLLLVGEEV